MSDDAADKVDQSSATDAAGNASARGHSAPTDPEDSTRFRIGAAAFACVAAGVGFLLFTDRSEVASAFLRVGILGVATCLAFPTLQRIRWRPRNGVEKVVVTVVLVLMVARPRVFVPLGLILGVLMLFKLPTSKKPQDNEDPVPPHEPMD